MTIKFAELPEEMPWAIGPTGELVINSRTVNDLEDAYNAAIDDYYATCAEVS